MEIKKVTPLYLCSHNPPCPSPCTGPGWWCNKVTDQNKHKAKNKDSVELFEKFTESFDFLFTGEELICVEKEEM